VATSRALIVEEEPACPLCSLTGLRYVFRAVILEGASAFCIPLEGGSGKSRLTTNAAGDSDPAWSPNGKRIAFLSDRSSNHNHEIHVLNPATKEQQRLTTNRALDYQPTWQPLP
jgi:TolB protein